MLQLDNDFASRGFNVSGPTKTSYGFFAGQPYGNNLDNPKKPWKNQPDRFLRGGNEDQPEGFKIGSKEESTGGSSADGLEFSSKDEE